MQRATYQRAIQQRTTQQHTTQQHTTQRRLFPSSLATVNPPSPHRSPCSRRLSFCRPQSGRIVKFATAMIGALVTFSGGAALAQTATVSCISISSHDRVYCPLPAAVSRVYLQEQFSKEPCIFGTSWGLNETLLWAAEGCAASFKVHLEGPLPLERTPDAGSPAEGLNGAPHGYVNGRFRREA